MSLQSFLFISLAIVVVVTGRSQFALDERWVCGVKNSCFNCLKLPHCSWCETEKRCFSKELSSEFCKNETVDHVDFGLSFQENAECSCANGKMDLQCYPPGVIEGPECSNRGQCVCGHCVCDPTPEPEYPTKAVMGEYCEFDNFSCVGTKCNEGPYSLSQPRRLDVDEIDDVAGTDDDTVTDDDTGTDDNTGTDDTYAK